MSRLLTIALEPQCLRQAAGGDRAAQRLVYDQTAAPVFALIRRLVRSRAAAEGVLQDCVISLLHHPGALRGDAPFGAWVRQVATRQCLMHLRSPWQRARRALGMMLTDVDNGEAPASSLEAVVREHAQESPIAELIDLERALARL